MNRAGRVWAFLTERWSVFDAAGVLLCSLTTTLSISLWRETPFPGLPMILLLLIVQGALWYSTGRKHQIQADTQEMAATAEIRRETHKLLKEAYLFEMWAFDLRADAEHKHILINSRVSTN